MAHRVITPPTVEPIDIADLRKHLRIDAWGEPPTHPEDDVILGFLSAAREHAEDVVGFALAPQGIELALDAFPCSAVLLPGGSVSSIDAVTYVDEQGFERSVDPTSFVVDNFSEPNWLLVAQGAEWPATLAVANGVRIRYTVGAGPLPASIRTALLLMVGHWYENREAASSSQTHAIPFGVDRLLFPHRINLGV